MKTWTNQDASQFTGKRLSITLLLMLISVAVTALVSRCIGRKLGAEHHKVRALLQAIQQDQQRQP